MKGRELAGGRYRLERTLGRGGMASVHLAHDLELDRRVAVKLLGEHLAGDERFRERFVREARLAAGLSHPAIVQVYDAGEDDGRPYIVMELIEGETLAERVTREGRLAPAEAIGLALQACGALEHAHAAGLVHRDVKPQNLLLRDDGSLKIVDFGIARAAEESKLTDIGTVLGTAAYLAPEQAAGEDVTPAADLYALGAVLYELLTGRPPYDTGTFAQLAAKQQGAPVTPVSDLAPTVPAALEDLVMRCLARNPDYRPASASELAAGLADASPDAATRPLPLERPTTPLPVPGRRRPQLPKLPRLWPAVAGAAALVAAAVALLLVADEGGREPAPPAQVEPVQPGSSSAEELRNLADWLRERGGEGR